ncbi:hypothetical protein PG997_005663 [Apiospora hydei]|uniref:Uncharacterized protein n=1 Tax=Apiospora hydei TaxID=1337664 RepID=A0ABR1WLL3_9PEZI
MPTFHFTDQDSYSTCLWECSPHHKPDTQYRVLDLVIREELADSNEGDNGTRKKPFPSSEDTKGVLDFLANMAQDKRNATPSGDTHAKLVVLTKSGFIINSNFIRDRTSGAPYVYLDKSFIVPQEHIDGVSLHRTSKEKKGRVQSANPGKDRGDDDDKNQAGHDFPKILKSVLHVFIFNPYHFSSEDNAAAFNQSVDEDLANRLCLPLTMPSRLVNNRLAVVGQSWGDIGLMLSILNSA